MTTTRLWTPGLVLLVFVFVAPGPATFAWAQTSQPAQPVQSPTETRALPPRIGTVLGRSVFDSAGEDVGLLIDVVVDKDGKPVAGVIDVGGFLGVGTRRVAVAWRLLHFDHDKDGTKVIMDLTFDSAAAAPEFRGPDNSLIVIDRAQP
jgi:hypothetical protein